jgi:hypothetical protein
VRKRQRNWFAETRQRWILEMLEIYGFINREHLQRKFSISEPQASIDLRTFATFHPGMMQYDLSRKCYVATEDLRTALVAR